MKVLLTNQFSFRTMLLLSTSFFFTGLEVKAQPGDQSVKADMIRLTGDDGIVRVVNAAGEISEKKLIVPAIYSSASMSKNTVLPSNTYFYQLKAGDFKDVNKIILPR